MIEPEQIAAARKRLDVSQAELAKRSGVSQSLIAKIETGKVDPTYSKLKAISDALTNGSRAASKATVKDVMHREVVSMFATEPIGTAIQHLARHGYSQLPVVDDGVLVGTVTEKALLHHVHQHHHDAGALARPVRDVMGQALPQVPPEAEIEGVESLLDLFPAVLVAANGKIVGIVTRTDLLRAANR